MLSALFVTEIETAFDDNGVCVTGTARFSAEGANLTPTYTPPATIGWSPNLSVDHRTQRVAGAFWDFPDIAIGFRLTAARASSPVADLVVGGGPGGSPAPLTDTGLATLLTGLGQGQPAPGQPAADGIDTAFHLDLLIDAATLHLPFLTGAKLNANGTLEADPDQPEVAVTLPKIKLSFEQSAGATGTAAADPLLALTIDSFAAHDIDDPSGAGYGDLLRMQPPYALFGPDDTLGFGFNSLILDLSGTQTPPALLEKTGVGDDFRGLYFPDVRIFAKAPGVGGLAVDLSARELLIGFGSQGGVSGIFGLDIVNPADPQSATITIYDDYGGLLQRIELPQPPTPLYVSPPIALPPTTQWVVDVHGGQPPYNIAVDGQEQIDKPVTITLAPGPERVIPISIVDVHGPQQRKAEIHVALTSVSLTAPGGGAASPAMGAAVTVVAAGPPGYTITATDSPGQEKVALVFAPADATATIARNGGAPAALQIDGGRATIDLPHDEKVLIAASWQVAASQPKPLKFHAQFQYDQPIKPQGAGQQRPDNPAWDAFAAQPDRIRTIASSDAPDPNGTWTGAGRFLVDDAAFKAFVAMANADPAATITLLGDASKEKVPLTGYNVELAQRRIWAVTQLLRNAPHNVANHIDGIPEGEQPPADPYLKDGRAEFRRVLAEIPAPAQPATTNTAAIAIERPKRKPAPDPVKQKIVKREPAGSPEVQFKELHVRLELDRNRVVALEFRLKIDVETALESYLKKVQQTEPTMPPGQTKLPVGRLADPTDGTLDIRVQVTLDDTVGRWQVLASLFENDSDGLLQTPLPTAVALELENESFLRDFFGVMIAITPLIDATASSNTPAGDIAALSVAALVPLTVVGLKIVHVPRITLYGGELVVSHDPNGTRGALLLDVGVALIVKLALAGQTIIDTDPKNPITVRYKAIGFTTSDTPQIRDLIPVFDSSKGYTIDIPSGGGIKVPDPLGQILQIAGTRIARSNPINLELDLELKTDLGFVTVDKTTIRIPLEEGHAPSISALGVHINIPGAIEGSGYLAIYPDGFAGQIDLSLAGLGIRVAGGLSVRHITDSADPTREATAILVTLEVDFPVPIALGASGLGIYGFGGLFAYHFRRNENPNSPVPALDWLASVDGNPMKIDGWEPAIDNWALGLGAVLGTMDAGFTLNVKGMLIFEMPGPRILLVMKANILWVRPPRQGNPTAAILAVIDVDLGRGRITIGLTFDYAIKPLLSLHVPVRAIFPFDDLPHFAIDVGSWYAPATVTFFDIFTARGYLMIRGKGIPDAGSGGLSYDQGHESSFPLPVPLGGFSIAMGVSASYIWGNKSSGLYVSVGSALDMGIGFKPIMFAGKLRMWGELHLWIVGIEASAGLDMLAGQVPDGPPQPDPANPGQMYQPTKSVVLIDGEVHGEVDFFFFSVSGSVHVSLGTKPDPIAAPPPLITGISLQSRTAALLAGVNSDRPIDGKLADARPDATAIPDAEAVPIDSIIVLHLDCTPRDGGAFVAMQADGQKINDIGPVSPPHATVRRGESFFAYRLKTVTLDHDLTRGEIKLVWWPNVPNPEAESKRELALLTRVPSPHPSAVERSKHAKDLLDHQWATVCDASAVPAPVLWTFHDAALGPSSVGWILTGTAWPDELGVTRSQPPRTRLDVAETWRSGDMFADLAKDVIAARVIGGLVICPEGCTNGTEPSPASNALKTLVDALPAASSEEQLAPVRAALPGSVVADSPRRKTFCRARLLEAPFQRAAPAETLRAHPLGGLLGEMLAAAAAHSSTLDDVVAFSTGGITHLRVLLYVPSTLIESGALRLHLYDAEGKALQRRKIDGASPGSRVVTQTADLPATWLNGYGPWHCRVGEVLAMIGVPEPVRQARAGKVVLIDLDVPEGTSFFQIGIDRLADQLRRRLTRPSFFVGIVETLSAAEVERYEQESKIKDHQQNEINGALSEPADVQALLRPATEYTVTVVWEYAACKEDGTLDGAWTEGSPQPFRFRTDAVPLAPRQLQGPGEDNPRTAPVRLDPWVVTTDPDEGERFYFHGQSLKIVLSVDYLLAMFQAYGVELEARVRAASFKNGAPDSPLFAQTLATLADHFTAAETAALVNARPLTNTAIHTPWEGMIRESLAAKPCVDTSGGTSKQVVVDLDLLLSPMTDFILEIEPKGAQAPSADTLHAPLFRRNFTTSRYADAGAMCAHVGASRFSELPASAGDIAKLVALGAPLDGRSPAAIDDALRAAGLRPVLPLADPEIEALWVPDAGGVLQPRVLILRTTEPLFRTRKEPVEYEPPGQDRLQRKVIALTDKPYLEVVQKGAADAPAMQIVGVPGLNLTIVLLDGARNKPIGLALRSHDSAILGEADGFSEISLFTMTLDAAAWEVA